jgi:flagellar basal body-associated protein FliL
MSGIKRLDLTTKIVLIILVVVISFLIVFSVLSVTFVQEPPSGDGVDGMGSMMDGMMGGTSLNSLIISLVALTVALVAGALVSIWILSRKPEAPVPLPAPVTRRDELDIIKRVLSDDERAVLDEIGRAGEITQDSLRFRLEWSKSKLSRILTNMDKMNLIQRERVGKTYTVFLTGKRRKE